MFKNIKNFTSPNNFAINSIRGYLCRIFFNLRNKSAAIGGAKMKIWEADCTGCTTQIMCAFCWTGIQKLFTSIFLSAAYVLLRYINILVNRPVFTIHHFESRVISQVILLATVLICFVHARTVPLFWQFTKPILSMSIMLHNKITRYFTVIKIYCVSLKLLKLRRGQEKSSQT